MWLWLVIMLTFKAIILFLIKYNNFSAFASRHQALANQNVVLCVLYVLWYGQLNCDVHTRS